ncbi:hypothetical protein JTB14_023857 [Gonioctena quinquepunctata]|nr:hypothetical protein JTB14_023857 [Gonioctena quinquepunctata]
MKAVKKEKRTDVKKKLLPFLLTEENNIDIAQLCEDSSDTETFSDEGNFENEIIQKLSAEPTKNICLDDYVLVQLTNEKATKEFVGQIIDISKNGYDVKFMRQYRENWNIFVFPEVNDISVITGTEIIGKLRSRKLRYGKVQFDECTFFIL